MARTVLQVSQEIAEHPARSAWDRGVRDFAEDLFKEWADNRHLKPEDLVTEKVTEEDQLNGASDWSQYSWGGCFLVYDCDICRALYSPAEQKRLRDGDRRPNRDEEWLDVQARALSQAARLVRRIANRREIV